MCDDCRAPARDGTRVRVVSGSQARMSPDKRNRAYSLCARCDMRRRVPGSGFCDVCLPNLRNP